MHDARSRCDVSFILWVSFPGRGCGRKTQGLIYKTAEYKKSFQTLLPAIFTRDASPLEKLLSPLKLKRCSRLRIYHRISACLLPSPHRVATAQQRSCSICGPFAFALLLHVIFTKLPSLPLPPPSRSPSCPSAKCADTA